MNSRVLVDTSVWIKYFNEPNSQEAERLTTLLEQEKVYLAGVVLAEILQGTKNRKEFNLLRESLTVLPLLRETDKIWEKVGELAYSLRKRGIVIPLTDCLLAVLARENKCSLFSLDRYFQYIPDLERTGDESNIRTEGKGGNSKKI